MGFMTFLHNIKYLFRYNIKHMNRKIDKFNYIINDINLMIDNQIYENPDNCYNIKKPKIYDFKETLNILCTSNMSLIRFGDGEVVIMDGGEIGFQRKDNLLADRLKKIIR